MKKRFYLYCGRSSNGGRDLIKGLNGKRIKNVGSKYRYRNGDIVINWGSTHTPFDIPYINPPRAVAIACSKTRTFETLKQAGIPVPDCTGDPNTALAWNKVGRILGRDLDNGSRGRGIAVYHKGTYKNENHKFFVKYFKKEREFRFHVVGGEIIHVSEKLRGPEFNENNNNKYVRSHDRGWILGFHHFENNPYPTEGLNSIILAVNALGLHFGAVDCGWNKEKGYCVFEVNTAPGIEGTTLEAYIKAFQ